MTRFTLWLNTVMVALFTRAWIEIIDVYTVSEETYVALFTRAWIEMPPLQKIMTAHSVALFTRAWIEIREQGTIIIITCGRPLHEGVD